MIKKKVVFCVTFDQSYEEKFGDDKTSTCSPSDTVSHIADSKSKVKKNRRRNKSNPVQVDDGTSKQSCSEVEIDSGVLGTKEKFGFTLNKSGAKDDSQKNLMKTSNNGEQNVPSSKDNSCNKVNKVELPGSVNSEITNGSKTLKDSPVLKKGVKRNFSTVSELSGVSSDVIENSEVEPKATVTSSKYSIVTRQRSQSCSVGLSNLNETSLSPAQDNVSFKKARRQDVKVIPETEISESNLNTNKKRKINAKKNETTSSFNVKNRDSCEEKIYLKGSEFTICDSSSPQYQDSFEVRDESPKSEGFPKRKLKSSRESL
uniref:Uncharacterized protein n=1 Tax=Graphocephala atropunctata TaxID=36148 RepID=A0A1B6KP90_9HEMI